jgi:hypothetical protein
MLHTLSEIAKQLNNRGVAWGVGASLLLNRFGLADNPHDIDIVVDIGDINSADELLSRSGVKRPSGSAAGYSTRFFYEYAVNGIEVDIMAGFAINHDSGTYDYIFDRNAVSDIDIIDGVRIPYTALEDWFVLYQLMPGREKKASLIEAYLLSTGIRNPMLLNRALEGNLPGQVRVRVEKLLDKQNAC